MHELGMCESIVDAVARRAGERPVRRVKVRVGTLHRVEADAFAQSFAMAAAGTVADGAETELVVLPVAMRCTACGTDSEGQDLVAICPQCGSTQVELNGGDELLLESIEYRA